MDQRNVMLVDGMALLFRGYYAQSYGGYIRKTSSGLPTNAIFGFLKYLLDAIGTFSPTHVVCCWDLGSTTFRTGKYDRYKANRPEAPADLIPQFDLVKEVASSFNIPNIGVEGYEADDCIGTLARRFEQDSEVHILTGDHDLLQLISERTKVVIMKKGQSNYAVYDSQKLWEEKQLSPRQIIDLKGLTGDTSDNYPGVKGIGEKTATKLLLEYETIDGIVSNLHALPKSVKTKIENELDMLHLCRDLATIHCETPIECSLSESIWRPDIETVRQKMEELELHSLMKQLNGLTA